MKSPYRPSPLRASFFCPLICIPLPKMNTLLCPAMLMNGWTSIVTVPGSWRMTVRLVPAMTKDEAVSKLKAHLAARGFDDVQVIVSGGYGPNETEESSLLVQAQKRLFGNLGIPYSIRPRNAGSWPGVVFNGPPLNLPATQFGLGRGGGAHAPNEWFLIESSDPKVFGLDAVTMAYVDYLYVIADEARKAAK